MVVFLSLWLILFVLFSFVANPNFAIKQSPLDVSLPGTIIGAETSLETSHANSIKQKDINRAFRLFRNLPVQLASSAANMQSRTPSQSQLPVVVVVVVVQVVVVVVSHS